jgi:hypothetical protein
MDSRMPLNIYIFSLKSSCFLDGLSRSRDKYSSPYFVNMECRLNNRMICRSDTYSGCGARRILLCQSPIKSPVEIDVFVSLENQFKWRIPGSGLMKVILDYHSQEDDVSEHSLFNRFIEPVWDKVGIPPLPDFVRVSHPILFYLIDQIVFRTYETMS